MQRTWNRLTAYAWRCAMLALAAFGTMACGWPPTRPDVGAVVVPDRVKVPPLPKIVAETEPLPSGYFQRQELERIRSGATSSAGRPTGSMTRTDPAASTR